jgi:hypothetical protein
MVGKKVTSAPFRIVAGLEWVASADESHVASTRSELHMKRSVGFGDLTNLLENSGRKKWIVN